MKSLQVSLHGVWAHFHTPHPSHILDMLNVVRRIARLGRLAILQCLEHALLGKTMYYIMMKNKV